MSHYDMFIPSLRRLLVAASTALAALAAQAQGLVLPGGLRLEPPAHLDLTYQVVPAYDEQEKVIAGWAGERLQYLITVSRLPPGHTDAQAYHAGLARDLRAAWETLLTGRSESYRATDGLSGTVVEYIKRSTDPDRPNVTLFTHFLTDGRGSYVATVTVMPPAIASRVYIDAMSLMRTAGLSETNEKRVRSEDALIGVWTTEEKLPDGRVVVARTELKADLSFATRVRTGEQVLLEARRAR